VDCQWTPSRESSIFCVAALRYDGDCGGGGGDENNNNKTTIVVVVVVVVVVDVVVCNCSKIKK